ncbi:serine/threonine-protein kinase [Kineosporia babensis]|uniref:non-specific serine/threonine protein kinase n=1 Tax=Kineosporia babensis TaxID=499548 RepID=A0A9X1SWY5_9ACTN|nr:serine/threonine-protein kinase [Kineosporia babensis]MCD5314545.1 serine/threonine protein kinase [Kineosporia babensis]
MPDASKLRTGDPAEVSGYRILRRLGQGGQGVVFLGVGPDGARVAVKQLKLEDERSRLQFAKEVSAARRVAPFCTARIIAFDLEGESPYVVSEFIEGPSLQRLVRDTGPITGTRLQRLAIGTATALAAIHQAGVVHRDLKPANVMISPEGPRVIDFGIARDLSHDTTVTSRIFGTPAYMAPEQIRSERVSPQTDMFAWASVIAFAATGRAPFEAGHMMAVVHRITTMEPSLDGVPDALAEVLKLCLNKDAAQRPSAQQALAMLLGRPQPAHDQADPTLVLAEGSRVAATAIATGPDAPVGRDPDAGPDQEAGTGGDEGQNTPTTRRVVPAWTSPEHSPEYGTPETPPNGLPVPKPRRRGVGLGSSAGAILAVLLIGGGIVGGGAYALRTFLDQGGSRTTETGADQGSPGENPGDGTEGTPGESSVPSSEPTTEYPGTGETAAPTASVAGLPEWTSGTWVGDVFQPVGQVSEWQAELTLAEGAGESRIEIRELGCSGALNYRPDESSADSVVLTTQLEDDLWDRCADSSTVRLTRSGDGELVLSWQDDSNASNVGGGTFRIQ